MEQLCLVLVSEMRSQMSKNLKHYCSEYKNRAPTEHALWYLCSTYDSYVI